MRKLMTLENLFAYFSAVGETAHYKALDGDNEIVVVAPGYIDFSSSGDNKDKEGLTKVLLQACHTELNANQSYISEEVMTNALPSFRDRPILAYIHDVDGQPEFYKHNMHEENGEIVYDERPVGHIPADSNPRLEYDEEKGRMYVVVEGCLYDEYSKSVDILQREGECAVSVELSIRELSYNAKDKYLNIEDFWFSGVTILGKDEDGEDVDPGMIGSNVKIANSQADISQVLLSKLDEISSNLNKIFQEGGTKEVTKFEELCEQYNVTADDIDFEYEDLTEEELEAKFAEVFGSDEPENFDDDADNGDDSEGEGSDPEGEEAFSKVFSISHEDIRSALYGLLAAYEEADGDWYWIEAVYDDHFAYSGLYTGNIYGQKYITDGDNVSFDGERYALHRELLTDSEYATLQEMRSNYSSIADKLAKYESEPEKLQILQSADYSQIAETEAYRDFMKQENHFDLSVDEVRAKADEMLLEYAKTSKLEFAAKEDNNPKLVNCKKLPTTGTKKGRYGSIFSKK